MFPLKHSFDTLLLMILRDHPEGLTGYSLIKELKQKFGPIIPSSPGTIYPRLKKLVETGDLLENEKNFVITNQGMQKLNSQTSDIIDDSLSQLPAFVKNLLESLPIADRISRIPNMMDVFGCGISFIPRNDEIFDDKNSAYPNDANIPILEEIKKKLVETKATMLKRLEAIDAQIASIDLKIAQLHHEAKAWQKPKIEWDTDENT